MSRSHAIDLSRTYFVEDPAKVARMKEGDKFVAALEHGLKRAFGIPDDFQRGATESTSSIDDGIDSGYVVALYLIPALARIHPENYDDALTEILTELQGDPKLPLIRRAIDEFIPRLRAALGWCRMPCQRRSACSSPVTRSTRFSVSASRTAPRGAGRGHAKRRQRLGGGAPCRRHSSAWPRRCWSRRRRSSTSCPKHRRRSRKSHGGRSRRASPPPAFLQGLQETGWAVGRNLRINSR